jgi:hypothetical protein
MALTPWHMQLAGVAILVVIVFAFGWWLVRVAIARPLKGRHAYWLQDDRDRDDDESEADDGR